jgi:hypothetical protein
MLGMRTGKPDRIREVLGIPRPEDHHPPLIQVESNIEEWPVFQLGRSKENSARVERTITGEDGSELRQRMEVSAPGKYRLPGRFDYDVYSAVMELLEIRGGMPKDGTLGFSLHELILIMGLEPSGRTYEEVKRSLRRIAATVLESDNAFWSSGQERHISDTFNLWNIRFDAVTDRNGSGSRHEIEFGKLFRRSFEEHYLRGLDIEFYWQLDSPVAKRLYRLVDLKRSGAGSWNTDLFDLQKYIPIGPYKYVSKIKEKLAAAHEELLEKGFLSDVAYRERSLISYEIAGTFRDRRKGLELAGTQEDFIAIKLLTESGLRGDVARDLVAKHGPGHCTRYANALPHQKNVRNPAGWLRRAIEDGYRLDPPPFPTGPVPEESREGPSDRSAGHDIVPPEPDPEAQDLLEAILEDISAQINIPSFSAWFLGTVPVSLEGGTLTLSVPNSFAEEYIRTRFAEKIEEDMRQRLGERARLSLTIYG